MNCRQMVTLWPDEAYDAARAFEVLRALPSADLEEAVRVLTEASMIAPKKAQTVRLAFLTPLWLTLLV